MVMDHLSEFILFYLLWKRNQLLLKNCKFLVAIIVRKGYSYYFMQKYNRNADVQKVYSQKLFFYENKIKLPYFLL